MTTITIERAILDRLIDAWDSTVLPKSRDGMMQERMEDLRAALAAPAAAPFDNESWDTVSGEPQNLWCDEAGTATVEDGTVEELNAVIDGARGTP